MKHEHCAQAQIINNAQFVFYSTKPVQATAYTDQAQCILLTSHHLEFRYNLSKMRDADLMAYVTNQSIRMINLINQNTAQIRGVT